MEDKYEYSPEDSELWKSFLYTAKSCDKELYHILDWLRAVGTRLIPDDKFGYRLEPVIGANGWESMEQWNKEKKVLLRYQSAIIKILSYLRKRAA